MAQEFVEETINYKLWVHSVCGWPIHDHTVKNRLSPRKNRPVLVCQRAPRKGFEFVLPDYEIRPFTRVVRYPICAGCGTPIKERNYSLPGSDGSYIQVHYGRDECLRLAGVPR